jgi:tartrate-resistant acid phosphatase type 5
MPKKLTFFAISDFGRDDPNVKAVAAAMHAYVESGLSAPPSFILGIGDNFYPWGAETVDDKIFDACWKDLFLIYPSLRVPWKMVLGNHDYFSNANAQVERHYHTELNRDGYWYMPDRSYTFSRTVSSDSNEEFEEEETIPFTVDFYALDTNGADDEIPYMNDKCIDRTRDAIATASQLMAQSEARWKIAYGHHLMYTNGKGHGRPATRLRESSPFQFKRYAIPGFGLEQTLSENGVAAYFGGHEHCFMHHYAQGVHNFCVGASGAEIRPGTGMHEGWDHSVHLDWVGKAKQIGFVAVEITYEQMIVKFVGIDCQIMKQVEIDKPTIMK